jgi:hypothetical protein
LKTFLEQHIGVRVYYPEIANFYRDVQAGRVEAPLPLVAVEGFVEAVKRATGPVFDPSVSEAIEGSAQPTPTFAPPPASDRPPSDANQPLPPKDPLGEIDSQKAHDFTFGGVANSLWKAFLEGEKVHKAVQAWKIAGNALRPYAKEILDWLISSLPPGSGG